MNKKKELNEKLESSTDETKNKLVKFTVCGLNTSIKHILTKEFPDKFLVSGEVSGLKFFNGTAYFTLKDEESFIGCVIWKTFYEKFTVKLNNGDNITVTSQIDSYIKTGKYQLKVISFEKNGLGKIYENYLKQKKKWEDEGYFDPTAKKKFPKYIKNIGIVTSKDGAAIQDILSVLREKKFQGNVFIKNAIVQGDKCPESIKDGIKYFNENKIKNISKKIIPLKTKHKKFLNKESANKINLKNTQNYVDLILITRGGGSFEDLIGFSHKKVIKTIFKSKIFTISAVGHEIDFMLSDFVSDLRAPTPSIAAEIITNHNHKYWCGKSKKYDLTNIKNSISHGLSIYKELFETIRLRSRNLFDEILLKKRKLNDSWTECENIFREKLKNFEAKFNNSQNTIKLMNPVKKLLHGMAIIKDSKKNVIENSQKIRNNDKIYLELPDNTILECVVYKKR